MIRLMEDADIPEGMRLREAAGWNQTEADWSRLLSLEPDGCFVDFEQGRVLGTVTTLQYEKRFGWIGMLLTDPQSRRRGIGTRLLHVAVSYLESQGAGTLRLDGTPMGYGLYLRHGFVDEYEIQRWEGISPVRRRPGLKRVCMPDLDPIFRLDIDVFGADRRRLISALWQENPSCSAVLRNEGAVAGYALWRPGSNAWYLGPCVATTSESAEMLLMEMLGSVHDHLVYVDCCIKNPWGPEILRRLGFQYQRSLVRMFRGPHDHPGKPELIASIASPELG